MTDNILPFGKTKAQLEEAVAKAEDQLGQDLREASELTMQHTGVLHELAAETNIDAVEMLLGKLGIAEARKKEMGVRYSQSYNTRGQLRKQLGEKLLEEKLNE